MIIIMKPGTPREEIDRVRQELENFRLITEEIVGKHKVVIALIGDTTAINSRQIESISPSIEKVTRIEQPFKRASREFRYGEASEVIVNTPNGSVSFGEHCALVSVAGPCSVENEEMIVETAKSVKASGAKFLIPTCVLKRNLGKVLD